MEVDKNEIETVITIGEYQKGDCLKIQVRYDGELVKLLCISADSVRTRVVLSLKPEDYIDEIHYWTPESPNLYDVEVYLVRNEQILDKVETYFGMRKVHIDDGRIMLNNVPYYLKMVLDQGYWKESGLTAPDDDALKQAILYMKAMGFNGVRKHQKIEDPRFYYWADKLGILVWGEVPSAYEFCDKEIRNIVRDFTEFIRRDYNHPSIIAWVPLNESWGVRKMLTDKKQQNFGETLYHMAKAMDESRLVSTNDGWENVKTDIVGIHDYEDSGDGILDKYRSERMETPENLFPGRRRLFAYQNEYEKGKQALLMTEYGGIAMVSDTEKGNGWGYNRPVRTREEWMERYRCITTAIMSVPEIAGFCYTQLTDVYQEVNGILDMDHCPKFNLEEIRKINKVQ